MVMTALGEHPSNHFPFFLSWVLKTQLCQQGVTMEAEAETFSQGIFYP